MSRGEGYGTAAGNPATHDSSKRRMCSAALSALDQMHRQILAQCRRLTSRRHLFCWPLAADVGKPWQLQIPSHAIATPPCCESPSITSALKKGRRTISLQTKCAPTLLQDAFTWVYFPMTFHEVSVTLRTACRFANCPERQITLAPLLTFRHRMSDSPSPL